MRCTYGSEGRERQRCASLTRLSLDLTDSGFHYSLKSEFRGRLVQGSKEHLLLARLLERCQQRGWLTARGRQRPDSTQVIGAVNTLNQLELVGETLRHALNVLATVVPDWLKQQARPEWYERYGQRMEDYRLPKDTTERAALSTVIGDDGYGLLDAIEQAQELAWLKQLPAVQALAQVWSQQYRRAEGRARRLTPKEMPPAGEWIRSPYALEVRYGRKRDFEWVGYKVHLTECGDVTRPHLITQVDTVPAIEQDHPALKTIQAD